MAVELFNAITFTRKMDTLAYDDTSCFVDNLLLHERKGRLGGCRYLAAKTATELSLRTLLIDWLIHENAKRTRINPLIFAISVIDAFLDRDRLERSFNELKAIAVATLSLAIKFDDMDPSWYLSQRYSITIEALIFKTLGCNISLPKDTVYLRTALPEFYLDTTTKKSVDKTSRCLLLIIVSLGSDFLPSVIASAICKILSREYGYLYTSSLKVLDGVVDACVGEIIITLKVVMQSNLVMYKMIPNSVRETFARICTGTSSLSDSVDVTSYLKSSYFRQNLSITLLDTALDQEVVHINRGGYGDIYRATVLETVYARKTYIASKMCGDTINFATIREISIMLSLDHDNIAKIRHVSEDLQSIYLDLAPCDLRQWYTEGTDCNLTTQVPLAAQLLSAVVYMHDMGCLHRDIKSHNILVYPEAGTVRFVLADFGSARGGQIVSTDGYYTTCICTVLYRAPEILFGFNKYGEKLDVWSLLCTLYEFATKRILFYGLQFHSPEDTLEAYEEKCEANQIKAVFSILGGPTVETWPEVMLVPSFKNLSSDVTALVDIKDSFLQDFKLCPGYQKLLAVGLILNPANRPTAKALLTELQTFT